TGAVPIMPKIKGIKKEGVFAFRTLGDSEKIRDYIDADGDVLKKKKAVIIGGGLLGLEAAHSLVKLGLDVTVLHLTDKLMERQLDGVAAELLKKDLEKIGIKVLLNKEVVEVFGGDNVEGLIFKNGGEINADVVVVSIGIMPNARLAKESGVYSERGVVVSDTMQSYDPSVYAVGECIEHRGKTFGLVGPIFEQARVLANHLAGDARLDFKSTETSTRLKVPGIELFSVGNVTRQEGLEALEYKDVSGGVYKLVLLKENTIQGVLMYGNTEEAPELFSCLLTGEDVGERRRGSIFGLREAGGGGTLSVESMADTAIVCGCNGITKGDIVSAIESKGLFTREEVTKETRAGGSCGGCGQLIDELLLSVLGSDFQRSLKPPSLCECTSYGRADIVKNIREKKLFTVGAVMETLGWESVGCDDCRPALNYYLSMVWPLESVEDKSSRLINERMSANIQKDNTFSVVPRIYGGVVTPKELMKISEVAVKYKAKLVKITGGQRLDLVGIKKEDLEDVWKDIGMPSGFAYAKALRTVKTCLGEKFCRFGTQDSLGLGVNMERKFSGLWMPAKVKMGVSGCPRNCAESAIKDIGIVCVSGGYEIYVGGSGGIELKGAKRLCMVETEEDVIEIVSAFLQFYREEANYGERTFKWVRRITMEALRETIEGNLTLRGELSLRLELALSVLKDPWKERVSV
ncbi:MAG: nitrite reductase large subunit NirB, partial [Deltaproteobacteria bacterium]|nr:nitrite reductase large subunit NirB [Deltaproteobacteria bacterium]